ncbi:MAG: hypothetical protein A3J24_00935 [Deltaproteobacteria bacterium RIFCSPLOWO2_02_FULL_53_8]|nr:MAG: hypothetical protein A3J24_00935 [Deltaproteobacteria bacterium RIFCSPLOWO2_02_FULL_53_8]
MSGYAIIEELSGCAVGENALAEKLKCACNLLLEAVSFDQCAIYLWDKVKRRFTLEASVGMCVGLPKQYEEGMGVPDAVKQSEDRFCAFKKDLADSTIAGVIDEGMRGFRFALALPIADRTAVRGVLYLKAIKRARVSGPHLSMLTAAASILVMFIKYAEACEQRRSSQAELEQAHKQLQNFEQIMALADMAANIVHEIKSPLLSIGGFANRLKKHLAAGAPGRLYLDQITKEAARIEKVVDGMLRSLKENAPVLESDDMNDIVSESVDLFREEAEQRGINIVSNLSAGVLAVRADREQMKIAFDNLIANALQSMENTGTLTVSTFQDKDTVVVKVADSGGGIDPRYESYIFNPFFTTKKHGTGLGLPIANAIVMRHHGVIEVNNNIGVGVTFIVKLHTDSSGKAA